MIDALAALDKVPNMACCCTHCINVDGFGNRLTALAALLYRYTIYRMRFMVLSVFTFTMRQTLWHFALEALASLYPTDFVPVKKCATKVFLLNDFVFCEE
ncbi:MAG: hypothetical protein V4563_16565 [Pseudomonadota bacterium]